MAFTSEVTAKLNLDKSAFDRAWTSTIATVAKAGSDINQRLEKAFSFKDVFKGAMQGIGIASVGQIVGTITGYFKEQSEAAKDAEAISAKAVDRQRQYALSVASVSERYKILGRQVKDLDADIAMQKNLIADLSANPMNLISEDGRRELVDAKKKLGEIQDQRSAVLEQIDHEKAARRKAAEETKIQIANEKELAAAKAKNASELQVAQLKLTQLQREYNKFAREGNLGSKEANQNVLEQAKATSTIRDIEKRIADLKEETTNKIADENELSQARLRDANDLELAQIRLNQLKRAEGRLISQNKADSVEAANNTVAQREVESQIAEIKRNQGKLVEETNRQIADEKELADARLKEASELQKQQIRLNQLQREYNRLKKEGKEKTPEAEKNRIEQQRVRSEMAETKKRAEKELVITYVSTGREAATGKARPARPRGRTETERLADQAAENEMRLREAILKGDKVGAASYAERAAKGYAKAGKRIEDATSMIKKDTSDVLGNELTKANSTLQAIKANLDPAKIQ